MGRMRLNLVVLRCGDVEASRRFYESLGARFASHAHGSGPEHYASQSDDIVLELYPAEDGPSDSAGLGFVVEDLEAAAQPPARRLRTGDHRRAPGGGPRSWSATQTVGASRSKPARSAPIRRDEGGAAW